MSGEELYSLRGDFFFLVQLLQWLVKSGSYVGFIKNSEIQFRSRSQLLQFYESGLTWKQPNGLSADPGWTFTHRKEKFHSQILEVRCCSLLSRELLTSAKYSV